MKINLDSGDETRIEIIPLIDVIFCILTFFLLASLQLTRQRAMQVDLPVATTGVPQMRELMVVTVDNVGQTFIDQQAVTREQLKERLVGYREQRPDGLMVLYAPRNALYNDVVEVLDLLRSVGGDRVALATLPAGSDQLQPSTPAFPSPPLPGSSPVPNLNLPGQPGMNQPIPGQPIPGQPIPGLTPGGQTPRSPMPRTSQNTPITSPNLGQ